MALGALSIAAAVWAHRQPETPRSAQWALTPWVAPGARGERMLGAVLTLRAWSAPCPVYQPGGLSVESPTSATRRSRCGSARVQRGGIPHGDLGRGGAWRE